MQHSAHFSPAIMATAFAERDRAFDGRFVAAVTTTGIYCRPSCPARRPLPANTRFFATNDQAERAGFRACKRCVPGEVARDIAAVQMAIEVLRSAQERVSLAQLASECGYSPSHLQRVFARVTGLSPAAYGRALREERARSALTSQQHVTGAIYEAGFASPSRFYDTIDGKLGMTASAWSKGGAGAVINWAVVDTTLGPMLVAATAKGVCRLAFNESGADLAERFPNAELRDGDADFSVLAQRVVAAVERPASAPDIPLDVAGTAFQQRVWQELQRIPAGETRSYGELAAALGKPKASRAVGGANGANPVAVLVPCHRVIAADGSLGGYAYGEAIKRELLRREAKGEPGAG